VIGNYLTSLALVERVPQLGTRRSVFGTTQTKWTGPFSP
jgi:hypothetical protein